MAGGMNKYKRNIVRTTENNSFSKSIGKWIALNLLRIPEAVYDATGKVNITLQGLLKKVGLALGDSSGSRDYTAPEFDLQQIEDAYHADGYVREAIDKYVDLILKPGYDIIGRNIKAVEYIKARLAYMSEVTGTPLDVFLNEVTSDMIKYHNVIIGKARTDDKNVLPAGSNVKGLDGMNPIGGYFVQPLKTFQVRRDKNGIVKGWQQEVEGQRAIKFKPQDIVHMYLKREPGNAFAYPKLLSVIDDVRALREIEERILHMIYRNVHPMVHAKVGTKEAPGQPEEVDNVRVEIENMSVEGGIVTTDRVAIDTINTKNVIDADPYLRYFEKRVFTGLGVSETMMGRGDTANRSTGDNQKEEAVDRVKSIQRVLATFMTSCIISELLREGGFDPLNKPEDKVEFIFKDPDTDSKIKHEVHAIFLYQSNAITENEMRAMIGRDPVVEGERATLWFPQYGKKETEAQADNTLRPENQNGKKTSPKKETNSVGPVLNIYMEDLRKGLIRVIEELYNPNVEGIRSSYVRQVIKNTQTHVNYIETLVCKALKEHHGPEKFDSIATGVVEVFRTIYNHTVDTMAELQTEQVTKETVSALFDVFIEELKYLVSQLGEEEQVDG